MSASVSRLTHGHPTGYIAGGVFAHVIAMLLEGNDLEHAVRDARGRLANDPASSEVRDAVDGALRQAGGGGRPSAERVERLGGGWVAEQALAVAIYCALVAEDFAHGVCLAVNHSGDSDSAGSMAGQLLGAMHGLDPIPSRWQDNVELAPVLRQVADDLHDARTGSLDIEAAGRKRYS